MAVSAPALREALADVVGREHVLADGRQLEAAAVDGVVPRWVVRAHTERRGEPPARPRDTPSVSRWRRAGAARARVSGSPPRRLDLVLDLSRLDAVTEYVAEDMVASVEAGMTLGALGARLSPRAPAARPRPVWRRGPDHRRGARLQCERPAALPLRGRARPAARRPLRPGRRDHHVGRREGREVGDGLRRAQAAGGLARHARRDRGRHAPAPPAAPVERLMALRV